MNRSFKYNFLLTLVALLLSSENFAQRNNAFVRFYEGMTTRFNVYYNGELNYNKAYKAQLLNYNENFTQLLPVHPVSKLKGQLNNEYERTIEKCQKAIRLHSIKTKPEFKGSKASVQYKNWQQTEEYNPFLHNAWLMLARAQFYKGDFMAASSTFGYIARHFRNLPQVVFESQIWSARCLSELNWLYESEDALRKIKLTELNSANKALWNLTNADLLLKQQHQNEAIPFIEYALLNETNSIQKYRFNYLLGQIYQQAGNNDKAFAAYEQVIKLSPPYEMEFSARIRQTECTSSENRSSVLRKLNGMTHKSKNKDYLDQLYYAIGNIYLSRKDTSSAIKNYVLSIQKSDKNVNQKALTQIKLGDIYFNIRKYNLAQPVYSEAIATIGKEHPEYQRLSKRSDALDELIIQYQNVHLQDSFLYVSSLPSAEKEKLIKKIIEDLERKEAEEKKAAEKEKLLLAQAERQGEQTNLFEGQNSRNMPGIPTINGDKSWYFYNTQSVTKGKADFQAKWGSRKFEDNWRRRNKNSFNFGGDSNTDQSKTDNAKKSATNDTLSTAKNSDPKKIEFYLQQLPATDDEIKNANEIINDGMYNMGLVYKNRLEDFPLAITTFEDVLKRYPSSSHKADIYYNIYLIGQQTNDAELSAKFKSKLISEFPDHKYSVALSDPEYIQQYLKKKNEAEALYQKTYDQFLKNDYKSVKQAYVVAKDKYPLSKLIPKFAFLDALTLLTEKNNEAFKKSLNDILIKYPDSDISSLAGPIMKNIVAGKQITGLSIDNNIWNSKLVTKAGTNDAANTKAVEFTVDPISPHYILFVFPEDSTYNNRLLYEVAGFNFSNFSIRDFDFDMLPLQGIGLLRVKGFASLNEVEIYKSRLFGEKGIAAKLPAQLKTVLISEKNFESLLRGRTFDEYFSFFEKNFGKNQGQILEQNPQKK